MTKQYQIFRASSAILMILAGVIAVQFSVMGQAVSINTTGAAPNASAVLDVSSTSQGVLTPTMTRAQRDAIAGPATGLLIYQTDEGAGFRYFDGTDWVYLRGMQTVPGRQEINAGCIVNTIVPTSFAGFSSTADCVNGTGQVTWPAGLFDIPPVVNISSSVVPVPPPAPDIYCIPVYTAGCGPFINNDFIERVRILESTTGVGGPYSSILDRPSGCDDAANGNYFEVPVANYTATLSGNIGGACVDHWYRVEVTSDDDWPDEVQAFIDWNADGDFVDAGEQLAPIPTFGTSQGNPQSSVNFEVPAIALNGSTVMRCKSIYAPSNAQLTNPCSGGTFGDTEDYTLTIDCANSGPAPEVVSVCSITDVTLTSFDYRCTLLSGSPISPPAINFELVPSENY